MLAHNLASAAFFSKRDRFWQDVCQDDLCFRSCLVLLCCWCGFLVVVCLQNKNKKKSQPDHSLFANLVEMSGMLVLPEDCIAAVISFTTPRDACRLACVSTIFRSAADSNIVWDRFLCPISHLGSVSSSSKKELYLSHNLIHNGKLVISNF